MFEVTYRLLIEDEDNGERALSALNDIVEETPKFYKSNFENFFTFCYKIVGEK